MRNLEIIRRHKGPHFPDLSQSAVCVGEHSHIIICDRKSTRLSKVTTDIAETVPEVLCEDEALKNVFQIQFIDPTGFLFLATKGGSFLQTTDGVNVELNQLFDSPQGIDHFAVSPDSRLVAILTTNKTLLLLTLLDLECLMEHDLSCGTVNEADSSKKCPSSPACIVWRNDSRYFAVNVAAYSDKSKTEQRVIKIYDENGVEHSSSEIDLEDFSLLDESLAWQPSGGLLASYGKTQHGNAIIFFELNGLKRSHFLTGRDEDVLDITWNSSSDVLAIRYQTLVELWTRSNYVWMLKKILNNVDNDHENIIFSKWDTELPYRIHVLFENGVYITDDVTYSYSSGFSHDSAITASWNGNKVYCTPFRDNSAPPPYGFLQTTTFEGNVMHVKVSNFWDGFLCITYCGHLIFYRREDTTLIPVRRYVLPRDIFIHMIDGWAWPNISTLCCTHSGSLLVFKLEDFPQNVDESENPDQIEITELTLKDTISAKGENLLRIQTLSNSSTSGSLESNEILAEADDNTIFLINLETHTTVKVLKFPHVFATYRYIKLQNSIILFAHDPLSRQLYMGSSQSPDTELIRLSVECTSVVTFCDNLLLTTLSGNLEIFSKTALQEILQPSANSSGRELKIAENRYSRKIEKGSVIVSCCINKMSEPSLTLQVVPRGNFETICPRPLLISTIRATLRDTGNEMRYERIMSALRRHRLDYKVLIDEMRVIEKNDPQQSIKSSLRVMVDQVKDSHSLVLLVTDLDAEYIDCMEIIKDLLESHLSKENQIDGEQIRERNIEEAYLASLAKLGLLDEALMSHLIQGEDKEKRNLVTDRVKFLSYYCDNPDILFDTSLGTYDLGLASLVADCLGKDPKEYLPILDDLHTLTELKRRFKIDDKLRRFSKAVIHLINDKTTQHNEILKYLERHRLFTDVITCVETMLSSTSSSVENSLRYALIGPAGPDLREGEDLESLLLETKTAYGKYLEEHTKFKEAVILYRGGKEFDKAIDCAVRCGEWETALEMFYSRLQKSELIIFGDLCEKILAALEERKDYSSAARLCEIHLLDIPRAIGYWIRDRQWLRARCLAQKIPELRDKCVAKTVLPKLLETAVERKECLSGLTTEVSEYLNRWRVVKANKAKKLLECGNDDLDNTSETESIYSSSSNTSKSGSVSSTSSEKTFRSSSKSKRKQQRKLYSTKEGSPHEDLGITVHLWSTFEKIEQETKSDTSELIHSLWAFNENDLARELGLALDYLLSECGIAVHEIWASILTEELLEMKYRIPPAGWSTSWEKLCLHESSSKAVKQ